MEQLLVKMPKEMATRLEKVAKEKCYESRQAFVREMLRKELGQ